MGGLCIIIIKVYPHGTLRRLKRKGKIMLALIITFILPIFDFVFANKVDLFFSIYLSNWKTPLIKIMFVKFLLLLLFFTKLISLQLCTYLSYRFFKSY